MSFARLRCANVGECLDFPPDANHAAMAQTDQDTRRDRIIESSSIGDEQNDETVD